MAGARQGKVNQNQPARGDYPASQVQTLSNDSKFLFKLGQMASRRGKTPFAVYSALLSGPTDEINGVINQAQNNTYDYSIFDITGYHGPLEAAGMAWLAAHPPLGRH